jgi:hypothetical protein
LLLVQFVDDAIVGEPDKLGARCVCGRQARHEIAGRLLIADGLEVNRLRRTVGVQGDGTAVEENHLGDVVSPEEKHWHGNANYLR